jgi:malonyl CoA-acyl carrier protein transacylase
MQWVAIILATACLNLEMSDNLQAAADAQPLYLAIDISQYPKAKQASLLLTPCVHILQAAMP